MERITEGWVYMMSNESMPDLIKIGYSGNDPLLRAEQLNTTGTPTAFKVIYRGFVDDAYGLEQRLHKFFKANRVSSDREFFSIDPKEVYKKIHELDSPKKEDIDFDITENSDSLKNKLSRADFSKLNYKEQTDYLRQNDIWENGYEDWQDAYRDLAANELVCCLCGSEKKELDWRQTDEGKEETKKFPLSVQCTDTRQIVRGKNIYDKVGSAEQYIRGIVQGFWYSDIFADHYNDYSVTFHTDVDVDLFPRLMTGKKIEEKCFHKYIPYKYEDEWFSTIDDCDPSRFADEWEHLEKNEERDEGWIYGNEYIKALFSYEDKVADLFIKDGYKLSSKSISEINRFEKILIRDMKTDFKNYKRSKRVSDSLFESLSLDERIKKREDREDKKERRLKKILSSKDYKKLMKKKEKAVKKCETKRKKDLEIEEAKNYKKLIPQEGKAVKKAERISAVDMNGNPIGSVTKKRFYALKKAGRTKVHTMEPFVIKIIDVDVNDVGSPAEELLRLQRMGPELAIMAKGESFDYHARIKELKAMIAGENKAESKERLDEIKRKSDYAREQIDSANAKRLAESNALKDKEKKEAIKYIVRKWSTIAMYSLAGIVSLASLIIYN